MKINSLIQITLSAALTLTLVQGKIGFVYEQVRHGARAPLVDVPNYPFKVGPGILTAEGIR